MKVSQVTKVYLESQPRKQVCMPLIIKEPAPLKMNNIAKTKSVHRRRPRPPSQSFNVGTTTLQIPRDTLLALEPAVHPLNTTTAASAPLLLPDRVALSFGTTQCLGISSLQRNAHHISLPLETSLAELSGSTTNLLTSTSLQPLTWSTALNAIGTLEHVQALSNRQLGQLLDDVLPSSNQVPQLSDTAAEARHASLDSGGSGSGAMSSGHSSARSAAPFGNKPRALILARMEKDEEERKYLEDHKVELRGTEGERRRVRRTARERGRNAYIHALERTVVTSETEKATLEAILASHYEKREALQHTVHRARHR